MTEPALEPGPADVKALARSGLAGKALAKAFLDATEPDREKLLTLMAATGAERIGVTDDDGTKLGTISWTPGKRCVQVIDEHAFTDYVRRRYAAEIVETVRASFAEKMFAEMLAADACVDVRTGEEIPGVRIGEGDPYLTTRPSPEARRRAAQLIEAGGLRAITAGHHAEG